MFFTGRPAGWLSERVDLRADPAAAYVRKGCLPERYDALSRRIERALDRDPTVDAGAAVRTIEWFCR